MTTAKIWGIVGACIFLACIVFLYFFFFHGREVKTNDVVFSEPTVHNSVVTIRGSLNQSAMAISHINITKEPTSTIIKAYMVPVRKGLDGNIKVNITIGSPDETIYFNDTKLRPKETLKPTDNDAIKLFLGKRKSTKEYPLIGTQLEFIQTGGENTIRINNSSSGIVTESLGTWSYASGVLLINGAVFNEVRFYGNDELFLTNSGTSGEPADERLVRVK